MEKMELQGFPVLPSLEESAKRTSTPAARVGLTERQCQDIQNFLHLFSEVEAALKKKLSLRANDTTGVGALITSYAAKNPFWRDSADRLRHLADIRNVLTHQRSTAFGFPIAVTPLSVEALREIKDHLTKPEPVSRRYCRNVVTVSASDSLAHIVTLAFDNGFSQFPVVDGEQFGGLITETEITRWLGHRVKVNSTEVDLRSANVKTVLKEKDPTANGIAIFRFRRSDTPADEVMGMFSLEPTLQAVLLNRSGDKQTTIDGIVTQWDAARFR